MQTASSSSSSPSTTWRSKKGSLGSLSQSLLRHLLLLLHGDLLGLLVLLPLLGGVLALLLDYRQPRQIGPRLVRLARGVQLLVIRYGLLLLYLFSGAGGL